jgi:hypothetical protein
MRPFLAVLAAVVVVASAGAAGGFVKAPAPGPPGLEGVPVPQVPILAKVTARSLGETVDGITCQQTEKVAYHIHAHLAIFVRGKQRQVPLGIGIGPPWRGQDAPVGPFVTSGTCFMWLHTHTGDGIIHIESPDKRTYTLGQFFDVWGEKLSPSRAGPAKGKVTALVNGKVFKGDPRTIPLTKHALIQLDVGTPLVAEQKVGFAKL